MKPIRAILTIYLLLLCCALTVFAQSAASADNVVPGTVKFTGTLHEPNGKPFTGTVGVTFALYKESSGGAPLWVETQNVQPDQNGHYSVMLGSATSHGIPNTAFAAGEARWIGVQPSGQAEEPRVELVSVPYALKAADAQTLGGLPPSAFLLAPTPSAATVESGAESATGQLPSAAAAATKSVTTAGGKTNALAKFDAAADVASSQIFDTGTNVGIGTSSPKSRLDVKGAANIRGTLILPSTGTATATAGKNSQAQNLTASAFNSITSTAVSQTFQWQAEPTGNNTGNAGASLNLLFGHGSSDPSETGLNIAGNGQITFAPGQTFPGTGSGTVTSVGLSAPATDFSVSGSPVTGSGTLGLLWLVAPTSADTANSIVKRDLNGSFAAGVITAAVQVTAPVLTASQALSTPQVRGESSTNGNLFTSPIVGENDSIGAVQAFGIAGLSRASNGPLAAGVLGRSEGGGVGVFGTTNSDSGQGVWGESFATQAGTNGFGPDGVVGISHSSSGNGVEAHNNSGGTAVFASSNTGDGVLALSTSGAAVVGATSSGSAGVFFGNVDVEGTLSKSAGSFKIDHPLDPANKYLYHSFVESPDMMNVYNGNVVTDAEGKAVVQMPDWFEALNRDFRYQLTVIGQFAQAIVASEMANHSFVIRTDKPHVKVSWQVTGIRQDAYANAHRIPLEEAKPERERGLYLHPELFGAAAEKSIAAARHPGVMKLAKEDKNSPADSPKP